MAKDQNELVAQFSSSFVFFSPCFGHIYWASSGNRMQQQCINLPGADKSLARPGRKQARKHGRDARDSNKIETRAVIKFFPPCKTRRRRKFTPF